MRIPKFWARASRDGFEAPGWSFDNLAEAKRVAEERLGLLIQALTGGGSPEGRYLYGDRPVKEPVTEVIGDPERPDALITRNAYGALCLNTEDVVFVDVDVDPSLLQRIVSAVRGNDIKAAPLDRIRQAQVKHPGWGLRIYRTAAGFRVIATHARMAPSGIETQDLFDALGADPLYRTLCAQQQSFRARLTPKPWRIGQPRLPVTFPWRDSSAERRASQWAATYDDARSGHAVCDLVEELGPGASDPAISRIIALHDQWTLAPGKPLA